MRRYSIFYSITLISMLSITGIILAFLYLMQYDQAKYAEELNVKYSIIAGATLFHLNNFITTEKMEEQVKDYRMKEIFEEPLKTYILNKGEVLQSLKHKIGESSIISYKKNNYISITHNEKTMLLKDEEFQSYRYFVIRLVFALVVIVVVVAYILTIKKIQPLKRLKRQIEKFANGDLSVPPYVSGADEISELTNAFYETVSHIKKMNNSRQLFLRNIMHELKTPITKGRISVEMIEDQKQKQRLITVFEKLETIINEFSAIEKLTSGIGLSNVSRYRLIDLFDEAIDLCMIERKYIDFYIKKDMSINVDFKLFSVALKNIMDNGIKYSSNNRVKVVSDEDNIIFMTKGKKLDKDFEYYLAPFTQSDNSKQSLGLGLYIVDNIIKAHKLKFLYEYKNGENLFIFNGLKTLI